jgi:hypothetical protein
MFVLLSLFLILHALFSSLEMPALYVVNVVSNYTSFSLLKTNVVFLFLDGFNFNGNILLLVM